MCKLTCVEGAAQEDECQGGCHAYTQQHPAGGVLEQAVGLQQIEAEAGQGVERQGATA
jgi:hypothetical protein